jgi:hypothetical protein
LIIDIIDIDISLIYFDIDYIIFIDIIDIDIDIIDYAIDISLSLLIY